MDQSEGESWDFVAVLGADYGSVLPAHVSPVMTPDEHAVYWTCPRCTYCQLPGCLYHPLCYHDRTWRGDEPLS